MKSEQSNNFLRFDGTRLSPLKKGVVQEFPLRLVVNGRELATLVASPHKLNFLTVGFFRLQGFIDSLDQIESLGVCSEFGLAQVRLKGEIPTGLKPTLTSGCGTGISYNLPESLPLIDQDVRFSPQAVFDLMDALNRRTDQYRDHGGIHSAALGDGRELLLFAEDIGRHNTLDRIVGEAMFKQVDLAGKMLVTSGRISTEMVAKAARMGIALIASRTSPTDRAIELALQAGISLVGYVRAGGMNLYCGQHRLDFEAGRRIPAVTGVILAGGESRRMGSDKSLLPLKGARFIDHVYRSMEGLFDEVIIVTNSPQLYEDIPCRKVPDIYYAQGSLAGIHSGLRHAKTDRIFVAGCDMPLLNPEAVRLLCESFEGEDVRIPSNGGQVEPLHALYGRKCLAAMEQVLDEGRRRIVAFFDRVRVQEVGLDLFAGVDPEGLSFRNINTPQEYYALRGKKDQIVAADFVETRRLMAYTE